MKKSIVFLFTMFAVSASSQTAVIGSLEWEDTPQCATQSYDVGRCEAIGMRVPTIGQLEELSAAIGDNQQRVLNFIAPGFYRSSTQSNDGGYLVQPFLNYKCDGDCKTYIRCVAPTAARTQLPETATYYAPAATMRYYETTYSPVYTESYRYDYARPYVYPYIDAVWPLLFWSVVLHDGWHSHDRRPYIRPHVRPYGGKRR